MKVKKKALIVTTVASTIDQFCMNDVSILLRYCDVQVAANFTTGNNTSEDRISEFKSELKSKNIIINEIQFNRNPVSINNIKAYNKLKELIQQNNFDLIHCHTPIAAMLTRLAAKPTRKRGTKVIYTAHGFHFYKGAPLINWLLYYPVERWLARYTDVLITINNEDYKRAQKSFKAKSVEYISGVGIDVDKFATVDIDNALKRKELHLPEHGVILLSVGELNENKNHEVVIRALADIKRTDIHYVICGQGRLEGLLRTLSKELGLEKQVHILGFRKDIPEIYKLSDVFIFPSFREGLSVALMEAMASGMPVVCSNIRGNSDLIEDKKGGILVNAKDKDMFCNAIESIVGSEKMRRNYSYYNINKSKTYSIEGIMKKLEKIYSNIFDLN